jgi:hypothetical protein
MASSSIIPPMSSTSPSTIGEHSQTLMAGPTVSTEAVADVPTALPSSSGEASDPREGFVFPLVNPWYESSPWFLSTYFDVPSPSRD